MNANLESLFTQAYQFQQEGELTTAIRLYEQILSFNPHHIETLRFLGIANAQLGSLNDAITYFNQAVALQPADVNLQTNLALAYKKSHAFDKAIEHYQQALKLDPDYPQAHNHLGNIYALQNDYQRALRHYYLAVRTAPDFTQAHYNLGLLFLKHQELAAAKKEFHNVLILNPDDLNAYFYLGLLHLKDNALDEAEQNFLSVLDGEPEHVKALVNLGVIALQRAQSMVLTSTPDETAIHGQRAIDYFTKALALDEHNLEARNNLAATFMHYDRFENALSYYRALLQSEPDNIEYLYNSGVAKMALGHLQEARTHFETLLAHNPQYFPALSSLAAIHIRLEERQQAQTLLQRAATANPADTVSQFMLQALTQDEINPQTCPEYVKNLFNNYALYYEQHMQGVLHNTLPQRIKSILQHLNCPHVNNAVDLGCGTGLSGVAMRDFCEQLDGVDLSNKMLAEARAKKIYDQLCVADIDDFLHQQPPHYGLMVALDVLPYCGALDERFKTIASKLTNGGLFLFTCEISDTKPWALQETIRFCHHPDYVQTMCTQNALQCIYQEKIIARRQEQHAFPVMLYVAIKNMTNPTQ